MSAVVIIISQSENIDNDSVKAYHPLKLTLQNPNCNTRRSRTQIAPKSITELYQNRAYINYGRLLVDGHARLIAEKTHLTSAQIVPPQIMDCIAQYYLVEEDGLHQLAFEIFTFLGATHKALLIDCSKKLLLVKIRDYLGLTGKAGTAKAKRYLDQLIRLKYIKKNQKRKTQKNRSYAFTNSKLVLFHSESVLKYR